MAAAGEDGGLGNGFVALHQYFFLHEILLLPYFSTVMTQSGHMVAQNAQPMHSSGWVDLNRRVALPVEPVLDKLRDAWDRPRRKGRSPCTVLPGMSALPWGFLRFQHII
jgi:hypothetical protein